MNHNSVNTGLKLGLTLFLLSYSLYGFTQSNSNRGIRVCGEIKRSYLVKSETGVTIQLYKGEIVEIIDRSKKKFIKKGIKKTLKQFVVQLGSLTPFEVPKKRVRLIVSSKCSINGKKVLVKGSSLGYSEPESKVEAGRLVEGGEYTVVSFFAGTDTDWYRIINGSNLIFMPKDNINLNYSPAEAIVQKRGFFNTLGFHLHMEVTYLTNQDKKIVDPMVLSLNQEDITTELSDPIFVSSKPGTGVAVGFYNYKKLGTKFSLLSRLGYKQANFSISGFENPEHMVDVQLSELGVEVQKTVGYKAAYLSLGLSFPKRYFNNIFILSLSLNLDYIIEQDFITVKKPCNGVCLGKRDPLDIVMDLENTEYQGVFRIEWVTDPLRIALSANAALGFELGLSYELW